VVGSWGEKRKKEESTTGNELLTERFLRTLSIRHEKEVCQRGGGGRGVEKKRYNYSGRDLKSLFENLINREKPRGRKEGNNVTIVCSSKIKGKKGDNGPNCVAQLMEAA